MEKGMKRMVEWRGKDEVEEEVKWLDGYEGERRTTKYQGIKSSEGAQR